MAVLSTRVAAEIGQAVTATQAEVLRREARKATQPAPVPAIGALNS